MDRNKLHDLLHDFVDGELEPELAERVRRELEELSKKDLITLEKATRALEKLSG